MDTMTGAVRSDRLLKEFADLLPAETIDEALRQSTERIAKDARVQTFVPLLAERVTRERLTTLVQTRTRPHAL